MDHSAAERLLYEEVPLSADELSDEEDEYGIRLVQSIRQNARGDSSGIAHDWEQQLEAQNATFRDDLKAASGIGLKRKGRGNGKRTRAPRAGPALSHQVRALLGDGNQAYVDADLPAAIRLMSEVIRIEPRAASAWTVLAQCYDDRGQPAPAMQLRIMAAHLRRDPDEWLRLAQQSRAAGAVQQALYCYAKAYAADPDNVAALWDRAALAREVGDLRAARASLIAVLRRVPHDLSVLAALRPVLVELGDLATCAELYEGARTHYEEAFPEGAGSPFAVLEILVLVDLHSVLGAHERAIQVIRSGMRWLQGRGEQRYWDALPDDREYDLPDMPPRTLREGDIPPGFFSLDLNARQRLAVARIRMGDVDEGKLHASRILTEEPADYAPLFAEIADAYFERGLWAEARGVYEVLGADAGTSSIQILMQAAACYHMLGDFQEAAEVYESVIQADPTLNEAKMKLAAICEATGEVHRAYDLVCQVIDSRKRRPREAGREGTAGPALTTEGHPSLPADDRPSLFAEDRTSTARKAPKPRAGLTRAQLEALEREREREAAQGWARVRDLWEVVSGEGAGGVGAEGEVEGGEEGEVGGGEGKRKGKAPQGARPDHAVARREWLLEAEKLIEMFRETRRLFTTDRAANDEKIEHFRTIHFDDWLRMTMQYCFLVTCDGDYPLAEEILRHMMLSNAYVSQPRQNTLRIALATCSITAQRFDIVVEQIRKIVYTHQFNTEPIRLLLASLSSGLRPTDAFIRATLQKFLFREMKLRDAASTTPEQVRWVPGRRWTHAGAGSGGKGGGEDEDEDEKEEGREDTPGEGPSLPKEYSPVNMIAYGMTCLAARSYQSALVYLLHAYDCSPDDPMLCLLLAIASLGRAMQRQADNRHHLVAQALAFLTKYRASRREVCGGKGEADYNFGRAFQQLGLFSQAVTHYERMLKRAEAGETCSFVREAAYNLSLIYSVTGARPLADALYRKWLSI
ncbi:hypothetical protein HDZ31DRAFT_37197 [Schizophyllum fasciatum]